MHKLWSLPQVLDYVSNVFRRLPTQTPKRRYAGNYQRAMKSVVKEDNLTEIRERIRKEVAPLPPEQWKQLRSELMGCSKNIKEVNVDATLLGLCDAETQLRVAQSYLKYLESEGKTPNFATIGRILRMYYAAYQKGELLESDQHDILTTYRELRAKHEILDPITCDNLITALVVTSHWRESLELLDMIKIAAQPTVTAYSLIVAKAFQDANDMTLGWKLWQEMCALGKQPKCATFIQYLNTISADSERFHVKLDEMFQFIRENGITVSRQVVSKLEDVAKAFNVSTQVVKLAKDGRCDHCNQCQPTNLISAKEFIQLSASFMDKVLIRKDVFLKSSPVEIERFIRFIDRTAPYDVVIDGLNVAFSKGMEKPSVDLARRVASVVKHFKGKKKKKILVLGREHMNKWPLEEMKHIKQNASLFLTANLSQDDPFLLYATLKSGPYADFVSRDLMRTHAHLLGPELKPVFRRWQQEHQYIVHTVTDKGKVLVQNPIKFSLLASKVNSTWHLPFKQEYSVTPSESFEEPEFWLCLSTDQR